MACEGKSHTNFESIAKRKKNKIILPCADKSESKKETPIPIFLGYSNPANCPL